MKIALERRVVSSPAIPSPSRSLAPTPPLYRHAQPAREVFVRHLLLRAAPISFWHEHKSVYLRVPDFPNHSFMKKPSKSLYSPAIVDKSIPNPSSKPLLPSYNLINPYSINHPQVRNRTHVVPKKEAEVKSGRRWSSKSRRCSNRRCLFPRWSSSLPSSDRP